MPFFIPANKHPRPSFVRCRLQAVVVWIEWVQHTRNAHVIGNMLSRKESRRNILIRVESAKKLCAALGLGAVSWRWQCVVRRQVIHSVSLLGEKLYTFGFE